MADINIGKSQSAVHPTVWLTPENSLHIGMGVSDTALRGLGITTDGYEKPFVLVPTADGEGWQRYDLKYQGTFQQRSHAGAAVVDSYSLDLSAGQISPSELARRGVAFGLEVSGPNGQNASTVWLQSAGDNYKPVV